MRATSVRRSGIAAATLGATFSLMLGFSGPASAAVTLYQNDNANVKVSGGEVTALNACIADAKDGVIQTQQLACNQVATAGNIVQLENVAVWVTPSGAIGPILFSKNRVNVSVSGGIANAMNLCVADAKDGVVQTQQLACTQVATAGNILTLTNVGVLVEQ